MRNISILSALLICISCNVEEKEVISEVEMNEANEKSSIDPPGTYPEIKDISISKLKRISDAWEHRNIYCSDNQDEAFHEIKAIERDGDISYVVFSSVEENDGFTFYFNEFDGMGELMSRHELKGGDHSLRDKINMRVEGDYVFYFSTLSGRKANYFSLVSGDHGDTTSNVIDWDRNKSDNFTSDFTSPSGNKVITFYDTKLILRDLTDKSTDTLINQEYRGSWSFGQGCWNDESTKFYFDNSGSVACIWEIDIERKTLNKIVSEHYADHPFFFVKDSTSYIAYCENNCIKVATVKTNL